MNDTKEHSQGKKCFGGRGLSRDIVVKLLNIKPSDIIFDMGSGAGYYTELFAKECKKVVSVDIAAQALASDIYNKENIQKIQCNACSFAKEHSYEQADIVFFANSFHNLDCRKEVLSSIFAQIKIGARLAVVDFYYDTPFGPPKQIRILPEDLRKMAQDCGFVLASQEDLGTHYLLIFTKP